MASWTNARVLATLDAVDDDCNAGSSNAVLRIYSGTAPVNVDTALSGNTLLAELAMTDPAFGAAVDTNPGGSLTANAISDDTAADNTGTATFFRILDSNGVARIQGTVSATGGGGELQLNTTSIQANVVVRVTSLVLTLAEI